MSQKKPLMYVGLHTHRFPSNPEEERFAEAWNKENEEGLLLDYLLDTHHGRQVAARSAQEHICAATVIQWLGSPVGGYFLESLGYKKSLP